MSDAETCGLTTLFSLVNGIDDLFVFPSCAVKLYALRLVDIVLDFVIKCPLFTVPQKQSGSNQLIAISVVHHRFYDKG